MLVLQANEVSSFASPKNLELFTFFRLEVSRESCFGENVYGFLVSIGIAAFDGNIINLRANAEGCVRGQCPWGCGPCHEVRLAPFGPLLLRIQGLEQRRYGGILHVAIAAGLVQLV